VVMLVREGFLQTGKLVVVVGEGGRHGEIGHHVVNVNVPLIALLSPNSLDLQIAPLNVVGSASLPSPSL
jgi:hypothetical protein